MVEHLAKGELDPVVAIFDATMTSALPKAQLRAVWGTLITQTGAFKSQGKAQVTTQGDYRVAVVPMVFENAELQAKIVYDAAGKIAGLFFLPPPDKADPKPPPSSTTSSSKAPDSARPRSTSGAAMSPRSSSRTSRHGSRAPRRAERKHLGRGRRTLRRVRDRVTIF